MITEKRRRTLVFSSIIATSAVLVETVLNAAHSPSSLTIFAAEVVASILLGVLLYLRFGPKDLEEEDLRNARELARSKILALKTAYFASLTAAVFALRSSLYVASPPFYLAISLGMAAIGSEIVLRPTLSRKSAYMLLAQTTLLGLMVQVHFAWLNPNSVYSDMAFHWLGVSAISQTGHIPAELGFYQFFSGFHVLNAVMVELGLLSFPTYTVFNHFLMTIAIPSCYLLALEVTGRRAALFSALLMVMSIFFFLWVVVLPSLLGASVLIVAVYALVKYHRTPRITWWAVFWLLSLFVLISHPINAMILGIVLVAYWAISFLHGRSGLLTGRRAAPTMTYVVIYVSYLAFLAITAFRAFLDSIFASGPQIIYTRTYAGPVPIIFIVQSIASTIGFAILFVPATFALLNWMSSRVFPKELVVGLIVVLIVTAGLAVLSGAGPYGFQSARSLLYLSIFITLPAAAGALFLGNRTRRTSTRTVMVISGLLALSLLSTTSYLTGSGNAILADSVPTQTSYTTDSILRSRWFLETLPSDSPLALDPVLSDYLAPPWSGLGYPYTVYPINHTKLIPLARVNIDDPVSVAISSLYMSQSGYIGINGSGYDRSLRARAYDNGVVHVYISTGA